MRGILWKWLLFLGSIFWIALFVNDYYRKNSEQQEYLRAKYLEAEIEKTNVLLPQKKIPPALTFWKTLSMILSVSALIYIKRSSSIKNCSRTNLPCPYPVSPQLDKYTPPPRNVTKTSVFRACVKDIKDMQKKRLLTELYCGEPKKLPEPRIPICDRKIGVEIVQKKLESLEKTVASLKQRRTLNNVTLNSSSGIVSGSPAFRKFLSNCQTINTPPDTPKSLTQISIVSSQLSDTSNVPGSYLVSAESSSGNSIDSSDHQLSEIFNSIDSSISDESIKSTVEKSDLNSVKSDLGSVKSNLKSVKSSLRVVKNDLKDVKPNLKSVKPELKDVRLNLKTVNSNLNVKPSLRDIKPAKSVSRDVNVKFVKPEVKYVKSNLKNVKTDLKPTKPDLSRSKPTLEQKPIPNTQNNDDSSWLTISDNPSGSLLSNQAPEVAKLASSEPQVVPEAITEIFPLNQTFTKCSKTSVNSKVSINSGESENSLKFVDEPSVPGSHLVSSGNTSVSSMTVMSNSINITSVILGSSCESFDDDVLVNSLD